MDLNKRIMGNHCSCGFCLNLMTDDDSASFISVDDEDSEKAISDKDVHPSSYESKMMAMVPYEQRKQLRNDAVFSAGQSGVLEDALTVYSSEKEESLQLDIQTVTASSTGFWSTLSSHPSPSGGHSDIGENGPLGMTVSLQPSSFSSLNLPKELRFEKGIPSSPTSLYLAVSHSYEQHDEDEDHENGVADKAADDSNGNERASTEDALSHPEETCFRKRSHSGISPSDYDGDEEDGICRSYRELIRMHPENYHHPSSEDSEA